MSEKQFIFDLDGFLEDIFIVMSDLNEENKKLEKELKSCEEKNEKLQKKLDSFKPVIFNDIRKGTIILYKKEV